MALARSSAALLAPVMTKNPPGKVFRVVVVPARRERCSPTMVCRIGVSLMSGLMRSRA
jgi:hypothetical protein